MCDAHLCFEVIHHLLHTKRCIGEEANVVLYAAALGCNEVREAEVGRVILLCLLPQTVKPGPGV